MKFNVDVDIMCVCKLCANSTLNISAVTSFSLQQLTVDDEHGNNGHGGDMSLP